MQSIAQNNQTINGVLTVNTSGTSNTIRVENDIAGEEATIRFRSKPSNGSGWLHSDISSFATGYNTGFLGFKVPHNNTFGSGFDMIINHSGNVGIGTVTPSDKLHLVGSNPTLRLSSSTYYGGTGNDLNAVISTIKFSNRDDNHNYRAEIRGLLTGGWDTSVGLAFTTHSGGEQVERVRINHDGTVGIGTANTFGYQLAVNGTIGSTEVKVENTSAWPDFVFDNGYDLLTLEEVEQHINENGHLPEIPSEAEVTENGINLGEMNAKLLQKIEELTLHLIQEHKNTQELSKKIERLENELTTLKNEQKAKTSD